MHPDNESSLNEQAEVERVRRHVEAVRMKIQELEQQTRDMSSEASQYEGSDY